MIRTTPFHSRLSELNTQGLYTHWQGHLSALRYTHAPKHEYFAVRNAVGLFDTSPLFKYRIQGPDAERFLAGLLVRDIRSCRPGQAQYTLWCDERGFVMEDGVVFRHSETDFLLTAARPNLGWFTDHRGSMRVEMEDVSDDYGILAVQGPRSRAVLSALMPEAHSLPFFGLTHAKIGSASVTLSRTGYTGDLGFEVTVEAGDAVEVLDTILEAGRGHGVRPFGEEALMMLRIEAGLPLVDVEWTNSRLAFTDDQRVTPVELGMRWMLRGVADGDRAFIGGAAIRRELATKSSRWATRGHRHRLAEVGLTAPRRGAVATQGRAPAALRVGAPRPADDRRWLAGRLRHQLHVLPRAPTAHRPRAGPPRPGRPRDRGAHGARSEPLQHDGPRTNGEAAPVQPREEDGQGMSSRQASTTHRRTTPSSSAAATTDW